MGKRLPLFDSRYPVFGSRYPVYGSRYSAGARAHACNGSSVCACRIRSVALTVPYGCQFFSLVKLPNASMTGEGMDHVALLCY